MSVSEFHHVFNTLEVYPRAYHFQKRFKDVHSRFCNIIGKGSFIFKKSGLSDDLNSLKGKLEKPLEVYVVGRENIDRDDLVVTSEPLQRAKDVALFSHEDSSRSMIEEHGITLVVAHVQIKDFGDNEKKEVVDTIRHFTSNLWKTVPVSGESLVIRCQTNMVYKTSDLDKFRFDVLEELEKTLGLKLTVDQLIFGGDSEVVSKKISQQLETLIISGFCVMKEHLQSFVRNANNHMMDKLDVIETEQLIDAIQGFLKNGLGFVDILEDSQSKGESFEEVVLRHLTRIIRCAVLDPLSLKFNLTQDTCNQIAYEVKFEENMKGSVSKNTRYHLSKLKQPCEEMQKAIKAHNKFHRFPGRNFMFIAYPLRDDIRQVVSQLEEALSPVRRTVNAMKQMIYEIDGNLKQSIVDAVDQGETNKKKVFTDELKERILSIDGVYGTGIIFGQWEIHVEKDEVRESVLEVMNQYKVRHPIQIRKVLRSPEILAGDQVEHGGTIESMYPGESRFRSGTLGTFVDTNNNDLFALTCGHVICVADNEEHNVYIKNGSNQRQLFATSHPDRTIPPGEQPRPLIDIAAVRVLDIFHPQCTKYLKDDDGMLKSAVLLTGNSNQLGASYIYKYGAASYFTRGLVCAVNYTLATGQNDYLVLITSPPGCDDDDVYAMPGDSGSVNCMPDIDTNKTVKAVSMLTSGGLQLEGLDCPFWLSFQLDKGLEKLAAKAGGIQFKLPSIYNDQQMF